ncbi:membrane protein [Alteromonas sp. KUL17]|uniref:O-antigen ligase family protein n=1 Tax=Alteromonas sp. KUL17 TaxID=2480796 RepID=UPI0010FFC0A4|nr:O-antigen ligase family protein [Alteromonas sp. KUL17]GEA02400.1 membrane protein [Alteromonas sp. KUL17]
MISALLYLIPFLTGLIMAFRHGPILVFMVYQLDYFLNPQNKWWSSYLPFVGAQFYLVLAMIIVFVIGFGKYNQNPAFKHPQFKFMCLTVLMYCLAYFNAPFTEYHIMSMDAFLTISVVTFLVIKLCSERKHIYWIIDSYLFSAFLLSFYIYGWGRDSSGRVSGVGMVDAPDSNLVAAALAPTIVLFIAKLIADKRLIARGFYGVGLIFVLNSLILINSRGGFLGVAAGIGYFLFISFKNDAFTLKEKRAIFAGMILFVAAFFRLADNTFIDRMMSVKEESTLNEEQETGSTRVFFWLATLEMAKDHPFGAGAGGFQYYAPVYIPEEVNTGGSRNRAVHSTWFETLSEAGYLGLLFFSLMIFFTHRSFVKVRKHLWNVNDFVNSALVLSVSSGFVTFVVAMTFINRLRAEILYWLIAISICCVNVFLSTQSKRNESEK